MSRTNRIILTAALVALVALAAVPVSFGKDGDVRVAGRCTAGSTAKLKLSEEDGAVEVEFEVDQNRNGVPWKVVVRHDGRKTASATAVTRAPSGSFSVRRVVADAPGSHVFRAVGIRSGERCVATATF